MLPYVGGYDLADRYRFDEPWNSPHNSLLAKGAPAGMTFFYPLYHCPSDRRSSRWDTSYVMVVGPRTISAGPTSTRMKDITDGTSNTILVAEMCESGIHWMEPRDLRVEEMSFRINDPEYVGIASRHAGRAWAAFADGHTGSFADDIDPRVIQAMTTINGGEDVSGLLNP
jgi:prepilin-type processing-associated H-X9-DG protein